MNNIGIFERTIIDDLKMPQSSFKTYKNVDRQHDQVHFSVTRMEEIFKKHKGEPDEPHRHEFYTLMIVQEAVGKHFVDFNGFDLGKRQVYFIAPGQVHQMLEEEMSKGYVITFDQQFLMNNHIPELFIEDLNLFNAFDYSPPLEPSKEEFEKLLFAADEINRVVNSNQSFKMEAAGAWLKVFLISCYNSCSLAPGDRSIQDHQNDLLKRFKALINDHYVEWHGTSEYADALHITPDHLNKVVKLQTGKTAKEHIQGRITLEAKRLLHFSGQSIKEISFDLGFSEPANFSAFFKKCSGYSPSKFRP